MIAVSVETFRDLFRGGDERAWAAMGDTVTGWVRDNASALRYVALALSEGDPGAQRIFDALLKIAGEQWIEPLASAGILDSEVDAQWAAMHVIVFNLASVLLEPALSPQLQAPFFDPEQLQRWNAATTELYRRGFTR